MSDQEYAYLRDDFNVRSLRKDRLRQILLTHDVEYRSDMLKTDLIEIFQSEIVPRRAELRKQFLDVPASAANIENATPPRNNQSQRQATLEANEDVESSRARRARSRSPRRARSPARSPSRKKDTESVSLDAKLKPDLQEAETPALAPALNITEEPPKSPKSPRRRRANRKVEVSESETEQLEIPAEEIKVKVPRSPRRKRNHEESEAEQIFTSNNVFQSGSAKGKKRRTASPNSAADQQVDISTHNTQPIYFTGSQNVPVTDADISIDSLPLDADFVADLNAEVDRLEKSQADPAIQFDQIPILQQNHLQYSEPKPEQPGEVNHEPINEPISNHEHEGGHEINEECENQDKDQGQDQQDQDHDQGYDEEYDAQFSRFPDTTRDSSISQYTSPSPIPRETPARRGFIPSLAELSVSRAFAEQLEPFMAPTPVQTPRASLAPREQDSSFRADTITVDRSETPEKSVTPERYSSIELPEAEDVAIRDVKEVIGFASKLSEWRHKIRMPKLPHVEMPHISFLRIQAPHIRLPRIKLSSIKTVGFVMLVALLTLWIPLLLAQGCLVAQWYRNAWGEAEFCGVGAVSEHIYPQWTVQNTGHPMISAVQANIRGVMDELWPECVSCPDNAHCYQDRIVMCDNGYRQAAHPLASLGIWPHPPRCLPDWEAQRKLDVLSERAAFYLRELRAKALCDTPDLPDNEIEKTTSARADELRAQLFNEKSPLLADHEFEVLWQQVLDQLPSKHADVYVVSFNSSLENNSGEELQCDKHYNPNSRGEQMLTNVQKPSAGDNVESGDATAPPTIASFAFQEINSQDLWLASRSDELFTLKCRFRIYVTRWFRAHREQIIATFAVITVVTIGCTVLMKLRASRLRQKKIVDEFVTKLKLQRSLADSDPSGKTVPYLRATDLRSQVPKSELKTVQDALERIGGVRMRQIEIYGEITRIWEWAP